MLFMGVIEQPPPRHQFLIEKIPFFNLDPHICSILSPESCSRILFSFLWNSQDRTFRDVASEAVRSRSCLPAGLVSSRSLPHLAFPFAHHHQTSTISFRNIDLSIFFSRYHRLHWRFNMDAQQDHGFDDGGDRTVPLFETDDPVEAVVENQQTQNWNGCNDPQASFTTLETRIDEFQRIMMDLFVKAEGCSPASRPLTVC